MINISHTLITKIHKKEMVTPHGKWIGKMNLLQMNNITALKGRGREK